MELSYNVGDIGNVIQIVVEMKRYNLEVFKQYTEEKNYKILYFGHSQFEQSMVQFIKKEEILVSVRTREESALLLVPENVFNRKGTNIKVENDSFK